MKHLFYILIFLISSSLSYAIPGHELSLVDPETNVKSGVEVNLKENFSAGKREFVPTNEWQVVEDDQMLPSGLHISMSMKSGIKKARLIESPHHDDDDKDVKKRRMKKKEKKEDKEDSDDFNLWKLNGKEGVLRENKDSFSVDELKRALQKLKTFNKADDKSADEDGKLRFRSMEEIKKEMNDVQLSMKSDQEIVVGVVLSLKLLQEERRIIFSSSSDVTQQDKQASIHTNKQRTLSLINDLEYYMHQIDNANVLVDEGGLEVLWAVMGKGEDGGSDMRGGDGGEVGEDDDGEISILVMLTIAAISQNNPHAQVALAKTQILPCLLNIIINTSSSSSSFTHLQLSSLSALSAAIRSFPAAQQLVAEKKGFSNIIHLIADKLQIQEKDDKHDDDDGDNKDKKKKFAKFSLKFVTLVTDIWQEKVFNDEDTEIDKQIREMKASQYESVDLQGELNSCGWCDLIGRLFIHVTDIDFREGMLTAMLRFQKECKRYDGDVRMRLNTFKKQLETLQSNDDDDDDGYFKQILDNLNIILNLTLHAD